VREVLLDKRARERGLFEPREVKRLVESLDRDRNAPDRVWTLLILELWFREFIDGSIDSTDRERSGTVAAPLSPPP
jgi:asparagine synthase (glutamine-hydrolysing)